MTGRLPGIAGDLFPSRYLADRFSTDLANFAVTSEARRGGQLRQWWNRVATTCGPATGVRTLFDVAAMPLAAILGFQASAASFESALATAQLRAAGGAVVGLLVTRWARQPSRAWREAASIARGLGTAWCFVVSPPFFSVVRTRGSAARASVDFLLPDVFDPRSLIALSTLGGAAAYAGSRHSIPLVDRLLASAAQFQDRVREDLQLGVVEALAQLTGISPGLRAFDESLTIVYRVLFLLFAESRNLVPHRHPIYGGAYAIGQLCREAAKGGDAPGLWEGLAAISRLSRVGCRTDDLIVRPFNGRLFARQAAPSLEVRPRRSRQGDNERDRALRQALVALATRGERGGREDICYADLGVEQLGAVYERILDLDPRAIRANARPRHARHSDRRKQSGTFYTPRPLAEFVVHRALAPLVEGREADGILDLRVVDPAMGSGAFLVAACHYLAAAYERALIDEGRCAETDIDDNDRADIRRLVAERCLAGVDANPVAVQLARLSLWLATLARGKPLGFLDHRLRVGNSLVGASPDDLQSIPDARRARGGDPLPLFDDPEIEFTLGQIARPLRELTCARDDSVEAVKSKELAWRRLTNDGSMLARWRRAADLWCARWFWPSRPVPSAAELRAAIGWLIRRDTTLGAAYVEDWTDRAQRAAGAHGFFHWPIEFADVYYDSTGRSRPAPGFDAVIGNPPWEMLRRDRSAARDDAEGNSRSLVRFIRESRLYPSCRRGHVNLYQPFVDRALSLARRGGRVGLVVPWGLAVDDGAEALRERLWDRACTDTIVGFDNSAGLFPIHRGVRFAVLISSPGRPTRDIRARLGVRTSGEIDELSQPPDDEIATSRFPLRLSADTLKRLGGRGRRFPDARRTIDVAVLDHVTRSFGRLGDPGGWAARFGRELNVTEDRVHFGPRGLPVIEGKHVRPFIVLARDAECRIPRARARQLLTSRRFERPRLAYRDVAGVGNRVSLIAAIVPADVVTTHTLYCLKTTHPLEEQFFLCGVFNSFVANFVVRMLMGSHVTTGLIEDLPVPRWTASALQRRIARLARRLGDRSALEIATALQAAVARLYGLDRDLLAAVLETFPLVDREERDQILARFVSARGASRRATRP